MKTPFATLAFCALALPASADVNDVLDQHILPYFDGFAVATDTLAAQASETCDPAHLKPAYTDAFNAWMTIGDLRIGPSESGALSIYFWPDKRGFTPRTLTRLIDEKDPVVQDATAYSEVSIAARGFFALEQMLYDPAFADYGADSYSCALTAAITADLAAQAKTLANAWAKEFVVTIRTAGQPGNTTYLSEDEALRAVYTQILSSLEFTSVQRLGQPLGTFDRPRPARAEARRSERSLKNVLLASESAYAMAGHLADWDIPHTDAAMSRLRDAATRIEDPAFQDITDPSARFRLDALQIAVQDLKTAIEGEIGGHLGIGAGFNSQDGD